METNNKKNAKSINIIILVLIVVVGAAFGVKYYMDNLGTATETGVVERYHVIREQKKTTLDELKDTFKDQIEVPAVKDGKHVEYVVEGDNIARINYDKKAMKFVLKASSDEYENLTNLNYVWGSPILMTSVCDDGAEVDVVSNLAEENTHIMKGEWYDNDLYYSMYTTNLTTREDFLQEINRVIIENHISFTDEYMATARASEMEFINEYLDKISNEEESEESEEEAVEPKDSNNSSNENYDEEPEE